MKNIEYNKEAIKRAMDIVGDYSLTVALDTRLQTIHSWINGEAVPSVINCFKIERATNGQVKARDIRPDINNIKESYAFVYGFVEFVYKTIEFILKLIVLPILITMSIGMAIIWGGFKIKDTYNEYQFEKTLQVARERAIINQLAEIKEQLQEIKRYIR